jgi:hypothetical protein
MSIRKDITLDERAEMSKFVYGLNDSNVLFNSIGIIRIGTNCQESEIMKMSDIEMIEFANKIYLSVNPTKKKKSNSD